MLRRWPWLASNEKASEVMLKGPQGVVHQSPIPLAVDMRINVALALRKIDGSVAIRAMCVRGKPYGTGLPADAHSHPSAGPPEARGCSQNGRVLTTFVAWVLGLGGLGLDFQGIEEARRAEARGCQDRGVIQEGGLCQGQGPHELLDGIARAVRVSDGHA